MNELHLSAQSLSELLAGRPETVSPNERAHAEKCDTCRTEMEALREFLGGLRVAEVATSPSAKLGLNAKRRLMDLRAFESRLAAEDAAAIETLARAGHAAEISDLLDRKPELRSVGMVRGLVHRSESEREARPAVALEWAELAVQTASRLGESDRDAAAEAQVQGVAEKELANVFVALGRIDDGFAAIDRAERSFSRFPAPEWDLAGVAFVRATLLGHRGEFQKALAIFRRCRLIFESMGAGVRAFNARTMEAAVITELGDADSAAELLRAALSDFADEIDDVTRSRALFNLGNCEIERRRFDDAEAAFSESLSISEYLGGPSEVARLRWRMGSLMVGKGELHRGVDSLLDARRRFLELRIPHGAAAVSVEAVEALLSLGRRADARELCRQLPEECLEFGWTDNALLALTYLRECEAADRLTPPTVRAVRVFLERIPAEPGLRFVPPSV